MKYQHLTTSTDVNNCISTNDPSTDPLGFTNCVRASFGLPPIAAGTVPAIDNNTLLCLQSILSQYKGQVDANGVMHLPFQSVIDMINKVRACVGLPSVHIPTVTTCTLNNCMAGITSDTPPTDISKCLSNCISSNP